MIKKVTITLGKNVMDDAAVNNAANNVKPSISLLLKNPVVFLAFGFGSGLSPKMPGTIGTLAAIPIYLLFCSSPIWIYLGIILISSIIGIWLCGSAAKTLGVHDHGGIVWDEFVGFWITMFCAPPGWEWILVGFIFFRAFDILKPWPISIADKKVGGGWGIMLDDILAGIAAALCLQAVNYFELYNIYSLGN